MYKRCWGKKEEGKKGRVKEEEGKEGGG